MPITDPIQLAVLKAHIDASPDLSAFPLNQDGSYEIAAKLNQPAVPPFIVWKSVVPNSDVGRAFVATGLSSLTSANNDRLIAFALWNPNGITPWRADHRQFFDDVFSTAAGASTRAALLALWKREASRIERLYAAGTGTDASPATLVFEGPVSYIDVDRARYL